MALRLLKIFIILSMLLGGITAATEYVAYRFDFQQALGEPLFELFIPFYNPLSIISWAVKFYNYHPEAFQHGLIILSATVIVMLLLICFVSIIEHRQNKSTDTYGSARWATKKDLSKMKISDKWGVVLGEYQGVILRHSGPEHMLMNAPSRSGKGVSVVVPTLLSWPCSVVVMDIKGENWALSSGFRSQFSYCLYFNPVSTQTAKWNPLMEVRKGLYEVRDVQNIADILANPSGSSQEPSHWQLTGHSLIVAAILHVLYAEEDKTLNGVASFLADPDRGIIDTLQYMMTTEHKDGAAHPIVASIAREMLNKAENELSGVLSTAMSFLGLYRDPVVANCVSANDFYLDDLMNADKPVSLYMIVPPSDISRLRPLNRLMINMMMRKLTEKEIGASGSPHKHRLLLLMDEFASLGSMDFFKTSLGFLAGYGIKCLLIVQSLNNLIEHYGARNSILDNCHCIATMAPNDNNTANEFSASLGSTTVKRNQVNVAGKRISLFLSNISVSGQESKRMLMNPDEVKRLGAEYILVLVAKQNPVLATRILYYKDKLFTSRLLESVNLNTRRYPDKPPPRKNDWDGCISEYAAIKPASAPLQPDDMQRDVATGNNTEKHNPEPTTTDNPAIQDDSVTEANEDMSSSVRQDEERGIFF